MPRLIAQQRLWYRWGVGLALASVCAVASVWWPVSRETLYAEAQTIHSIVTDRHGVVIGEHRPGGRARIVNLAALDSLVVEAVVATEDKRFFAHHGVDVQAVFRAVLGNLRAGEVTSGASTLTMQVAKQIRNHSNRNWVDKLFEAHLALRLERSYGKTDIIEAWLNRVPFGNQTFGIEAAAQFYFGKSAAHLSTAETTFLVGLPKAPSQLNPLRHFGAAKQRQQRVLDSLVREGMLRREIANSLHRVPLRLVGAGQRHSAPHLADRLVHSVRTDRQAEYRTTLDARLQDQVTTLARHHVRQLRGVHNAAVVVLDNASGDVLSYVGNVDYWDDQHAGQVDGVQMLRQPGSTLKPFTYAIALDSQRYTTASILPDIETNILEAGAAFSPENYDRVYHGPVSMRQALACSYNVPAVRLAHEFGAEALLKQYRSVGLTSLDRSAGYYGVGITLGNGEVKLMELAEAYAALARGGVYRMARFIDWALSMQRDTTFVQQAVSRETGISTEAAFLIGEVLRDAEAREPAFGRSNPLSLPFPVSVKTGTSKDYRDNWAVGFSPQHTVAVWVGNFDGSPMPWVSGVSGAGPILNGVFQVLGHGGDFAVPPHLENVAIDPLSGTLPATMSQSTQSVWFMPGTAPTDTSDIYRTVHIDTRTGLRATQETPEGFVEAKQYVVYPPLYHHWMDEQGLERPPPRVSRETETGASVEAQVDARLSIQYPDNGTQLHIDPVLNPSFQEVELIGSAPSDLFDTHWRVNGHRLDAPSYTDASWPLEAGTHELSLHAIDGTGQAIRSVPARVVVHAIGGERARR
ncbi:MAG: penicillin-binding protein 1C [Bacteroidota bacterium]